MPDDSQYPPITRREFNTALMLVWTYIMLLIGDFYRRDDQWTTFLLWVASLLMMLTYLYQIAKSRSK